MIDWERRHLLLARRTFLGRTVGGLGSLALASLLEPRLFAGEADGRLKVPHYQGVVHPRHFTPKVKRIIWLYMAGGPSHLETLDHKPKLAAMNGKPMPESFTKGQPIAQLQGAKLDCFGSAAPLSEMRSIGAGDRHDFSAPGLDRRRDLHHPLAAHRGDQSRSGPHVHEHRHDDLRPAEHGFLAVVRPGQRMRQPARLRRADVRWAGTGRRSRSPRGNGTAAFCPAASRASSSTPRAIRCCTSPAPRRRRDAAARRGRRGAGTQPLQNGTIDDPEIATRISQYEMAFRMQT